MDDKILTASFQRRDVDFSPTPLGKRKSRSPELPEYFPKLGPPSEKDAKAVGSFSATSRKFGAHELHLNEKKSLESITSACQFQNEKISDLSSTVPIHILQHSKAFPPSKVPVRSTSEISYGIPKASNMLSQSEIARPMSFSSSYNECIGKPVLDPRLRDMRNFGGKDNVFPPKVSVDMQNALSELVRPAGIIQPSFSQPSSYCDGFDGRTSFGRGSESEISSDLGQSRCSNHLDSNDLSFDRVSSGALHLSNDYTISFQNEVRNINASFSIPVNKNSEHVEASHMDAKMMAPLAVHNESNESLTYSGSEQFSSGYGHDRANSDGHGQSDASNHGSRSLDQKSGLPSDRTASMAAEKLWSGSLQLNSSITVSAVAFFKSGERVLDTNWSESVEVKGKVRLNAFERYIHDLPRSRSRGLMVISLCLKDRSSEAGLKGIKEIAEGYVKGERVGFAQLSQGIDLYLCPRNEAIITILAKYGFFKGMAAAAIEDNSELLIGCVVWRKNRAASTSAGKRSESKANFQAVKSNPDSARQQVEGKTSSSTPSRKSMGKPSAALESMDIPDSKNIQIENCSIIQSIPASPSPKQSSLPIKQQQSGDSDSSFQGSETKNMTIDNSCSPEFWTKPSGPTTVPLPAKQQHSGGSNSPSQGSKNKNITTDDSARFNFLSSKPSGPTTPSFTVGQQQSGDSSSNFQGSENKNIAFDNSSVTNFFLNPSDPPTSSLPVSQQQCGGSNSFSQGSKEQLLENGAPIHSSEAEKHQAGFQLPRCVMSIPSKAAKYRRTIDDDLPEFDFRTGCGISLTSTGKHLETSLQGKRHQAEGDRTTDGSMPPNMAVMVSVSVSETRSDNFSIARMVPTVYRGIPPSDNVNDSKPQIVPWKVADLCTSQRNAISVSVSGSHKVSCDDLRKKTLFNDEDDMPEWFPPENKTQLGKLSTIFSESSKSASGNQFLLPAQSTLMPPSPALIRPEFSSPACPAAYRPPKVPPPIPSTSSGGFTFNPVLRPRDGPASLGHPIEHADTKTWRP